MIWEWLLVCCEKRGVGEESEGKRGWQGEGGRVDWERRRGIWEEKGEEKKARNTANITLLRSNRHIHHAARPAKTVSRYRATRTTQAREAAMDRAIQVYSRVSTTSIHGEVLNIQAWKAQEGTWLTRPSPNQDRRLQILPRQRKASAAAGPFQGKAHRARLAAGDVYRVRRVRLSSFGPSVPTNVDILFPFPLSSPISINAQPIN